MKTPAAALDWLNAKCSRGQWASVRASREVEENWQLSTGGRIMSASLSATVERCSEFELSADAPGVEPDYVLAAKNGAVTVLVSQSWSPVFRVRIRLFNFRPHPEQSSYAAFYNAGLRATQRLIGVVEGSSFNIAWPGEDEA